MVWQTRLIDTRLKSALCARPRCALMKPSMPGVLYWPPGPVPPLRPDLKSLPVDLSTSHPVINLTIYNPRDFKYRVRHPLVSTSWRLREYTDFDEWHLKSNLMTWCWNWYDFYVDSPLLSDVAMSWKTVNLAHFAELNIQRYCHFMPFDKKLACLANYQERRSFPWPLVSHNSTKFTKNTKNKNTYNEFSFLMHLIIKCYVFLANF